MSHVNTINRPFSSAPTLQCLIGYCRQRSEEEDYLEYEVEAEEEEYDSDADPEYLPDVEELGAIDELLEEDIREIEEDKTKNKKTSSENTDSRKKTQRK
ncbi:hypothetical protein J6590_086557 [Homalodisca vitripennis]|nr:hypothetical protein J6590_086557 [Homalodisca vitripennis]